MVERPFSLHLLLHAFVLSDDQALGSAAAHLYVVGEYNANWVKTSCRCRMELPDDVTTGLESPQSV